MKPRPLSPAPFLLLALLAATPGGAQIPGLVQPCTCFDMRDLMNRQAEAEAAIAAYRAALAAWSAAGAIPSGNETQRRLLQTTRVQTAINSVTDTRANRLPAETDASCHTSFNAGSTACLREVIEQHEWVHKNACLRYVADNQVALLNRFGDLAEYANEEIEAYGNELAYVRGSLSNLKAHCRLALQFRSTISGKAEMVTSKTTADVDLTMNVSSGTQSRWLTGNTTLNYNTVDPGPPTTVIGPSPLNKKVPRCYITFEGKGGAAFDVVDGSLMRQQVPPFDPLVELTLAVGTTSRRSSGRAAASARVTRFPRRTGAPAF